MTQAAEKELDTIRQIMELLEPFPPRARTRILGYVKHFLRSPSLLPTSHPTTGASSGNADTAATPVKGQAPACSAPLDRRGLSGVGRDPDAPHGAGAEQRKEAR